MKKITSTLFIFSLVFIPNVVFATVGYMCLNGTISNIIFLFFAFFLIPLLFLLSLKSHYKKIKLSTPSFKEFVNNNFKKIFLFSFFIVFYKYVLLRFVGEMLRFDRPDCYLGLRETFVQVTYNFNALYKNIEIITVFLAYSAFLSLLTGIFYLFLIRKDKVYKKLSWSFLFVFPAFYFFIKNIFSKEK